MTKGTYVYIPHDGESVWLPKSLCETMLFEDMTRAKRSMMALIGDHGIVRHVVYQQGNTMACDLEIDENTKIWEMDLDGRIQIRNHQTERSANHVN